MKKVLQLCVILAICLNGCNSHAAELAAGDAVARATELYPRLESSSWYKVSVLGSTAGYANIQVRAVTEHGVPRLQVSEHMQIKVSLMGQSLTVGSDALTTYGPDLRPETYVVSEDQMGTRQKTVATVKGDSIEVVTYANGETTTQTLKTGPDFGSELQLSVDALEGRLKPGAVYKMQVFLPDIGGLDEETITVSEHGPMQVGEKQVNAFKLEVASAKLNMQVITWLDEKGDVIRQEIPRLMNLIMTRVSEDEALAEFSPLKLSPGINVGSAVGDPTKLTYLRLQATGNAIPASQLVAQSPRQTVTAHGDEATVEIRSARAPANPPALPFVAPDEVKPYLVANSMAQSDNPEIMEQARKIVGNEQDSWKAAQLICTWVYEHMHKVKSEPRPIAALEILHEMSGDCSEHATLAVALLRAAGIPARMVTGVAWVENAFWYHTWVEVYLGQWVEMDPTWGEALADAGHLRLGDTALDRESFIQMALATGRTIGTLQLQVEERQ